MAAKRGGLGRGLDALIPKKEANTTDSGAQSADNKEKKETRSEKEVKSGKGQKPSGSEKVKTNNKAVKTGKIGPKEPQKSEKTLPGELENVGTPNNRNSEKATRKEANDTNRTVKNKKETPETGSSQGKRKRDSDKGSANTQSEHKSEITGIKEDSSEKVRSYSEIKPEDAAKNVSRETFETLMQNGNDQESKTEVASVVQALEATEHQSDKNDTVTILRISKVEPNREQPRKEFEKDKLKELSESILQHGVIQPLLVQKAGDHYEIIAGERRWRAAKLAGLKEVPVIIREYSPAEAVEISLIENIQREDLNPIEEALAYARLIEEFGMTQEALSKRVSKSRTAVTNSMRLLKLPETVREMLIAGDLTEGHARALLGMNDEAGQIEAARIIAENGLSVRDAERLAKMNGIPKKKKVISPDYQREAIFRDLENQLKGVLGTKVSIAAKGKNKGKIEIEYYSDEELDRLIELLRSVG